MGKKILLIALCGVLLFGVTGCNDDNSNKENSNDQNNIQENNFQKEDNVNNTNEDNSENSKIVGKWKVTETNSTTKSIEDLFGESASKTNELIFKQDGTYTLHIGDLFNQSGKYTLDDNAIRLSDNEYLGGTDAQTTDMLYYDVQEILLQVETETNTFLNVTLEQVEE